MLSVVRQRNFFLLWSGGIVSMTGNWMLQVFLPIYIYRLTHSTLATGFMFMCIVLPYIFFGPVAGVFVDRWERKKTMVVSNLLLTLVLLPLLAVHSAGTLWIVYVIAFLESTLGLFVTVVQGALLPRLVTEDYLMSANSLGALGMNVSRLLGPALGGIAGAVLRLDGVVLIDAGSYAAAAALTFLIVGTFKSGIGAQMAPAKSARKWATVWREWSDAVRIVRADGLLSTLLAIVLLTSLGQGMFGVLYAPFVSKVLHGGTLEFGLFMSLEAVGGLIGGAAIGWLGPRLLAPRQLIGISGVAFGLIDLAIFNYSVFFSGVLLGMVLFFLAGFPEVSFDSSLQTLLQAGTADEYRGRVFGMVSTLQGWLSLIGMIVASFLGNVLGIVPVISVQGAVFVVAGFLALARLKDDPELGSAGLGVPVPQGIR